MGVPDSKGILDKMILQVRQILAALILAVLMPLGVVAQQNTSALERNQVHSFEPKEELVYVAEFSRALLKNVDVAEFRFTADSTEMLNVPTEVQRQSLRLTGEVFSKGLFIRLFNLRFRELMESEVERSSFTVQKSKRIDEQGKRKRVSEAVFANGRVSWIERDPDNPNNTTRTEETAFTGQIQDILSAIYFLRTQPLTLGKSFELTISDSGQVYQIPVKVVEKKRMKTVVGRVDTLRVDPDLFTPGMLRRKGHISIWYTNDSRRIPVSARIKTEYGTFNVTLRKIVRGRAADDVSRAGR